MAWRHCPRRPGPWFESAGASVTAFGPGPGGQWTRIFAQNVLLMPASAASATNVLLMQRTAGLHRKVHLCNPSQRPRKRPQRQASLLGSDIPCECPLTVQTVPKGRPDPARVTIITRRERGRHWIRRTHSKLNRTLVNRPSFDTADAEARRGRRGAR